MKAVIIAAGEGKRLRPLTLSKPKSLVEVLNKPLIQYVFEALPLQVKEVVLVVGYKSEMMREFIRERFLGRPVTYVEQKEPLGTAHALWLCRQYLLNEEKFLVMYADDLHSKDAIGRLIELRSGLLVASVSDPSQFGIVVRDEKGIIRDIKEKPQNSKLNLAATGVYIFPPTIFDYYHREKEGGEEYYLTEVILEYIKDFEVRAVETDFWLPIGFPKDITEAEKVLGELSPAQRDAIFKG